MHKKDIIQINIPPHYKAYFIDQIISNKCTLMHFGDNLVKILYVILEKVMNYQVPSWE
jgi:hypothetical protein